MAEDRMAVLETVRKAVADGDVDFLREGVRVLAQAVMEAEVTELTGLPKGERDPERRLTSRNGYRDRRWDTRVGTMHLAIPRVRDGSYFPSLLEPRRRAERALLAVVSEAYVLGADEEVRHVVRGAACSRTAATAAMTRSDTPASGMRRATCAIPESSMWSLRRQRSCGGCGPISPTTPSARSPSGSTGMASPTVVRGPGRR